MKTEGFPGLGVPTALIGRRSELETVDAALDNAAAGKGAAMLISGEAGIGKTPPVEETARWARERGFDVLQAVSYPADADVAHAPIVDAFGPFLVGLQLPERAKLTRGRS